MSDSVQPDAPTAPAVASPTAKNTTGKATGEIHNSNLLIPILVALFATAFFASPLIEATLGRRVLRIGIVDSQTARYLQARIDQWKPAEHNHVNLRVYPLSYEDLRIAERSAAPSAFDLMMVDDPWLANLVEDGKLAKVPLGRYAEMIPAFAPEILRVAFHRDTSAGPRRPTIDQVGAFQSHGSKLDFGLYGLPLVGNVQALLRRDADKHRPPSPTKGWDGVIQERRQARHDFYSRLGSNNSALADFLPLLWSEGGCLVGQDETGTEVSAFSYKETASAAEKALRNSLDLANRKIQYARFRDEDVQDYLEHVPNAIGISWAAFRSRLSDGQSIWYQMPERRKGADPTRPCAQNEERADPRGVTRTAALGVWMLAVRKASSPENQENAWDFITWIFHELYALQGPASVTCSPDDPIAPPGSGDQLKGYPTPFEKQMNCGLKMAVHRSRPRLSHPNWYEIEEAVGFRIRQAHWRTLSSEAAIKCAGADMRMILSNKSADVSGS